MLRLAVDNGQITAHRAAEQLHLSRGVAGATLRALERAGHLDGHLVGGGQIGYRPTARGREHLDADQIARGPIAAKA